MTVVLVTADAEFARNPLTGARANAERYGFAIVHEQIYPWAAALKTMRTNQAA